MAQDELAPKDEAWRKVYPRLIPLVDIGFNTQHPEDRSPDSIAQTLRGIVIGVLNLSLEQSDFTESAQKAVNGDVVAVREILTKLPKLRKDPVLERGILCTAIIVKIFLTGERGEEEAYADLVLGIIQDQNPHNN